MMYDYALTLGAPGTKFYLEVGCAAAKCHDGGTDLKAAGVPAALWHAAGNVIKGHIGERESQRCTTKALSA